MEKILERVPGFRPGTVLPFVVTFAAILAVDTLHAVALGAIAGMAFLADGGTTDAFVLRRSSGHARASIRIELAERVSFLQRASVRRMLDELPNGARVEIDATRSREVDPDVLDLLHDFARDAKARDIDVALRGLVPRA